MLEVVSNKDTKTIPVSSLNKDMLKDKMFILYDEFERQYYKLNLNDTTIGPYYKYRWNNIKDQSYFGAYIDFKSAVDIINKCSDLKIFVFDSVEEYVLWIYEREYR